MGTLLRLEIFPRDLDVCYNFYTNVLRFLVVRDERRAATPYLSLQRGSLRIGASESWVEASPESRMPPTGVEIIIEVEDVQAERDAIVVQGWPLDSDLCVRPWGLVDFRLRDPDGYYLRFTTVE